MKGIVKYLPKPILLLFCSILPGIIVLGQIRFTASADKPKLGMDGYLQVQYTIDNAGDVQQFTPPVFKNFIVIEGPTYVSSTILFNGKLCPSKTFIYILQPRSQGSFIFPPASVKINGKVIASNPVSVDVVGAASAQNQYHFHGSVSSNAEQMNLYSDYILKKGEDLQEKIRKNLFIKVDVDKTSCFAGEPIVATYKLYTRLKSESKVVKRPSFNGFSVYDMVNPESETPSSEKWNGKEYHVYMIRKAQLFPLQPGTLELDPAEVENQVSFLKADYALQRTPEALTNLIQSFVEDDAVRDAIQVEKVNIASNPVSVTVKALPENNKPAEYDGAVGKFDITVKLDKYKMAINDIATLGVTVMGAGNFGVINAPSVKWPETVETYEPSVKEDFFRTLAPMQGSKTFQFTFMPKQQGEFSIPPIELSYFDPKTSKYKLVKSDSIKLNVTSEVKKANQKQSLESELTAKNSGELKINRVWVLSTAASILVLLGGFLFIQIRRHSLAVAGAPSQRMKSVERAAPVEEPEPEFILSPLFEARLMLIQQNNKGFYSELKKSLWTFMGNRFHIPDSELNFREVAQNLRQNGYDEVIIDQFQLLVHHCEVALYTPDNRVNDMQSAYDLAEDLVENLSKNNQVNN